MITITRNFPVNIKADHRGYFLHLLNMELPEPGIIQYKQRVLILYNGIVLHGGKIQQQSLLYATRFKELGGYRFVATRLMRSFLKGAITRLSSGSCYIAITNEWTHGYFHWKTESLPKLLYSLQQGHKPVVLLPENYTANIHYESLKMLGVTWQHFKGDAWVSNVLLPSRFAPYPAHYNVQIMEALRQALVGKVVSKTIPHRKVYLSRRSARHRKIGNELEVIDLLTQVGFEVHEFENYSLQQQITLMQETSVFVSLHGGGLTNLIFCKTGTKVLEFSLENQTMDKCYFNLAHAMGVHYYYQFCAPASTDTDYFSADVVVDLVSLEKNIQSIVEVENV